MDTPPEPQAQGSRNPLTWFAVDLVGVLVFTFVGMLNHGSNLSGYLGTLWPFALGLAVAWAVPAVRALPLIIWPTGVLVWGVTTVVGLVLRGVTGDGVSGAFPFVAAVILAVLLIGWRVVPEIVERRRERRARYL